MTPEPAETVRGAPGRAKRLLWIAAAGLAVVLGGEGFLFLARTWPNMFARPGISRQNAERIRCGMSRSEVEAILGGPAGDYRTGPTSELNGDDIPDYWLLEAKDFTPRWKNDIGSVYIMFDAADRVGAGSAGAATVAYYDACKVRINSETFSRIKEGMSWREVDFILGGDSSDYRTDPTVRYPDRPRKYELYAKKWRENPRSSLSVCFWESDTACVCVEFTIPPKIVRSKFYWTGQSQRQEDVLRRE
jgi:hypothetical protein